MTNTLSTSNLRIIPQRIVGVIVMASDGKFLAGIKNPHPQAGYLDTYFLPGGGVEDHETDEQAARRELYEETGLRSAGETMKLVDNQGKGQTTRTLNSGETVLCEMEFIIFRLDLNQKADEVSLNPHEAEFKLMRWFSPNDLNNSRIKFVPATYSLFERLGLYEKK